MSTKPKRRFDYRSQNDMHRDAIERLAATVITPEDEPSMTIQDAPDSDINVLVKRMGITDNSILPANLGITDPGYYGDWDNTIDLKEALDRAHTAERTFGLLPADIRSKFNNDPYQLWDWIQDEKNHEEAVKLKLLRRTVQEPPKPVEPAPGASAPDPKATP